MYEMKEQPVEVEEIILAEDRRGAELEAGIADIAGCKRCLTDPQVSSKYTILRIPNEKATAKP